MSEASRVALDILAWARRQGVLANDLAVPALPGGAEPENAFPNMAAGSPGAEEVEKGERTLGRLKVVTVVADEQRGRAIVLTRNQVSKSSATALPDEIEGVRVDYIGNAAPEQNPPALAFSSVEAAPRIFLHNNRLACGSSVTVAPVHGAGTFGAIVRLEDGTLCGLTNNHVTGECNHSKIGMHVLCPSPHDADPAHPAPTAIGKHRNFVTLESGDPGQVRLQEVDAALFTLTRPEIVTSMQGAGSDAYDTPSQVAPPLGGLLVKKFGRTTGLTHGVVIGRAVTGLGIPYASKRFTSMVYFDQAWTVAATTGGAFSLGGDSGSLVVSQEGSRAIGLIFAGATSGEVSFMVPMESVLRALSADLVSGHGV